MTQLTGNLPQTECPSPPSDTHDPTLVHMAFDGLCAW